VWAFLFPGKFRALLSGKRFFGKCFPMVLNFSAGDCNVSSMIAEL
jgi:hypothetical protein